MSALIAFGTGCVLGLLIQAFWGYAVALQILALAWVAFLGMGSAAFVHHRYEDS